ncbi:hypothetical protein HLH34_05975 [Gluconacetobacter azotocaptans]|uniref:Uncharacterized protein n=1 Tax=Gluconacetobacter azotocaptans TaxID=142834 RepID=A0A7W4PDB3_9PROT|nr:hypothetical protein [Gluconacetobacter azotocaptans]MBB2189510.1 hypothetical protein [Gluconacetobacter azotocaptans]MBM9403579.1 hypothetical protein [Gluconacetobacter azotocaptans]
MQQRRLGRVGWAIAFVAMLGQLLLGSAAFSDQETDAQFATLSALSVLCDSSLPIDGAGQTPARRHHVHGDVGLPLPGALADLFLLPAGGPVVPALLPVLIGLAGFAAAARGPPSVVNAAARPRGPPVLN